MQATTPRGFSADTEILTRSGWVTFDRLTYLDEVATHSPDGRFEWQHPERITWRRYDGPMLHFRSQVFDLMVTPEHRMLVYRRQVPGYLPIFREASWFRDHSGSSKNWRMPLTSQWKGSAPQEIVVPAAAPAPGRHHPAPELHISLETWVRFTGWFVSEGYVLSAPHLQNVVGIAQSRELHKADIRETLQGVGVSFRENAKGFEFNHGPLARYLRATCYTCDEHRAWNKRLPLSVKEYPPELLREVFATMMLGDGHVEKTGLRRYLTTSKALADDAVEILQKMGSQGWYDWTDPEHVSLIEGRKVGKRRTQYRVTERPGTGSAVPKPHEVTYSGSVHCLSVPNCAVYVRRNGRTAWAAPGQ